VALDTTFEWQTDQRETRELWTVVYFDAAVRAQAECLCLFAYLLRGVLKGGACMQLPPPVPSFGVCRAKFHAPIYSRDRKCLATIQLIKFRLKRSADGLSVYLSCSEQQRW
jgi:hypothetical protein